MNVKSRFDTEEPVSKNAGQKHMRGMCGTPFEMISGPGRVDVSAMRVPKFVEAVFQALGWKTRAQNTSDRQN
ncbi:MAG TPA: hypothetical protein VMC09_13070 [Anaerolineales bacterium]|nr:hypothetical protein [Anaerolineales bacterium]